MNLGTLALEKLPDKFKYNTFLKLFGLTKIPMILFLSPKVIRIDEGSAEIKIPLNWRTKNHVGSMYFGAIAAGADLSIGTLAIWHSFKNKGKQVRFLFKDFKIDFLKRAEGNVHFICNEGHQIAESIQKAHETGERQNLMVNGFALVPSKLGETPVAKFALTISFKI